MSKSPKIASQKAPIEITAPNACIERLLSNLSNAPKRELHGKMWIEVLSMSDDDIKAAVMDGCQVHFISSGT